MRMQWLPAPGLAKPNAPCGASIPACPTLKETPWSASQHPMAPRNPAALHLPPPCSPPAPADDEYWSEDEDEEVQSPIDAVDPFIFFAGAWLAATTHDMLSLCILHGSAGWQACACRRELACGPLLGCAWRVVALC